MRLVVCGEVIIDGELHAAILAGECTYQLEDAPPDGDGDHDGDGGGGAGGTRLLSVSLVKETRTKARHHWPGIVRGERLLDVEALGNPIIAINENSNDDLQEYMRIMAGAGRGVLPEDTSE